MYIHKGSSEHTHMKLTLWVCKMHCNTCPAAADGGHVRVGQSVSCGLLLVQVSPLQQCMSNI